VLLLDTHVWVWFGNGSDRLSPKSVGALETAVGAGRFVVSPISVWEVAMLAERDRVRLRVPLEAWIEDALDPVYFELADLTPALAVQAARLRDPAPRDPADRLIMATALERGIPLATRDAKIIAFGEVSDLDVMPV
jgi:PIN domain nuclease of toxin-antitoxin system